jgi:hypothetical protein
MIGTKTNKTSKAGFLQESSRRSQESSNQFSLSNPRQEIATVCTTTKIFRLRGDAL